MFDIPEENVFPMLVNFFFFLIKDNVVHKINKNKKTQDVKYKLIQLIYS